MAGLRPQPGLAKAAGTFHIVLAVIVVLALAMEVHLWAIDADGPTAGAGTFLLVMGLGLPALGLGILAIVGSLMASDTLLRVLSATLVAIVGAALLEAGLLLVNFLAVSYVGLATLRIWLHWRRERDAKSAL